MAEDEESLNGLTHLLDELHSGPHLSRIQEIQKLLSEFERQETSWRSALYYIRHTSNEKVIMYCLSVLEMYVLRRWTILSQSDKISIRQFIEYFLIQDYEQNVLAKFILHKAAKVLVDIARSDWPHDYPDFFDKVVYLIESDQPSSLGLLLLTTACEEIIQPRESIDSKRRTVLRKLLNEELSRLLASVLSVVYRILGQKAIEQVCIASQYFDEDSFQSVLSASNPVFGLSDKLVQLCQVLLKCINSLFTWIPLDNPYQDRLIAVVFIFSLATHGVGQNGVSPKFDDIGKTALNCIQELLERNGASYTVNKYLVSVFHSVFCHLLLIPKMTKSVSEDYQLKLTEILRFLITNFASNMEVVPGFPTDIFLQTLKEFTFKNIACLSVFFPCLEVWKVYLGYLKMKASTKTETFPLNLSLQEKNLVFSLGEELIKNTLFNESGSHMDELEDGISDDIDEFKEDCEYQEFLLESFDVLSLVCEFCPREILDMLSKYFYNYWLSYMSVSGSRIREHEMHRLHWLLRDLATTMQAIGVIIACVKVETSVDCILKLLDSFMEGTIYGCTEQFYSANVIKEQEIRLDFIQVHAQNLATLQCFVSMFISWSSRTSNGDLILKEPAQQAYIDNMMNAISNSIVNCDPPRIQHAAASLLYTICNVLKPPQLMNSISFNQVFNCVKDLDFLSKIRQPTARLLVQSLSTYLIVESSQIAQNRNSSIEEFKAELHLKFVSAICDKYLNLNMAVNDKLGFQWCLTLLTDMIVAADQLTTFSRRTCSNSLDKNNVITRLTELLQPALSTPSTTVSYLNFFVNYVKSLGNVIYHQSLQGIVNTLLDAFHQQTNLDGAVLDSLLLVLLVIIDYRQVFIPLVPNVLKLCLFHIFPMLENSDAPDGRLRLFQVFFAILNNGFSYFFKAARPTSIQDGSSKRDTYQPDHQQEFCAIMSAIGSSFLQTDIEIVQNNLKGLMELNESRRLFSISVVKDSMLPQFLKVLFDCLIEKSHDLLSDTMISCVYKMAMVDTANFFSVFLPSYIQNISSLDASQKQTLLTDFTPEKDVPTFTNNVRQFSGDVRFYRMRNESLQVNSSIFSSKNTL